MSLKCNSIVDITFHEWIKFFRRDNCVANSRKLKYLSTSWILNYILYRTTNWYNIPPQQGGGCDKLMFSRETYFLQCFKWHTHFVHVLSMLTAVVCYILSYLYSGSQLQLWNTVILLDKYLFAKYKRILTKHVGSYFFQLFLHPSNLRWYWPTDVGYSIIY